MSYGYAFRERVIKVEAELCESLSDLDGYGDFSGCLPCSNFHYITKTIEKKGYPEISRNGAISDIVNTSCKQCSPGLDEIYDYIVKIANLIKSLKVAGGEPYARVAISDTMNRFGLSPVVRKRLIGASFYPSDEFLD